MQNFRLKIVSAVTQQDQKQSKRKGYNPHALPLYLEAADRAEKRLKAGDKPRQAVTSQFCGRLLDHVLKAIGEPPSTDAEQRV